MLKQQIIKFIFKRPLTFSEVQDEYVKLSEILMQKGLDHAEAYEILSRAYNTAINQKS